MTDSIPNGKERMKSQENITAKLQKHMWAVTAIGSFIVFLAPLVWSYLT